MTAHRARGAGRSEWALQRAARATADAGAALHRKSLDFSGARDERVTRRSLADACRGALAEGLCNLVTPRGRTVAGRRLGTAPGRAPVRASLTSAGDRLSRPSGPRHRDLKRNVMSSEALREALAPDGKRTRAAACTCSRLFVITPTRRLGCVGSRAEARQCAAGAVARMRTRLRRRRYKYPVPASAANRAGSPSQTMRACSST
jgi:hypothetical protein